PRSYAPLLQHPPTSTLFPYTTLFRSDEMTQELLIALVRRDFQSAGDALAAVIAATTSIGEAWAEMDASNSEGRLLVRRWLEELWRGVSKVASDFGAEGFWMEVVTRRK